MPSRKDGTPAKLGGPITLGAWRTANHPPRARPPQRFRAANTFSHEFQDQLGRHKAREVECPYGLLKSKAFIGQQPTRSHRLETLNKHMHSTRPQSKGALKRHHNHVMRGDSGNSHDALAYCMGSWHERTFSQVTAARRHVLEGLQQQ